MITAAAAAIQSRAAAAAASAVVCLPQSEQRLKSLFCCALLYMYRALLSYLEYTTSFTATTQKGESKRRKQQRVHCSTLTIGGKELLILYEVQPHEKNAQKIVKANHHEA